MSIGEKASQGFFSFLTRNVISRVMGLVSLFILARTLNPYDFGLVSFTEILLSFIAVFGNTGLNEFLISYKKDDFKDIVKSAFWFNLMLTFGMMTLFFIFIPFWGESKHDDRIIWLGIISGLTFFLTQLQVIPKAILSRNLDFKTLVKIQNPFIIIVPIAKIIAALSGMGIYSLTVPTLVFIPIQVVWFYKSVKWQLEWKLLVGRWNEIYHFSKHLIGNSLLTRLMDDGDKFILSSFLGIETLGVYNMAYQLSSFVGTNIVSLTSTILSSVLPKYRDDLPKMKEHFLDFTKVLSFFTFPIITLMAVFAEPLILATNGEKWLSVVVPFQILSIYALIRSVTSARGSVLNTLHLNKLSFRLMLVYAPIHIVSSIICSYYFGIIGVASSVVVIRFVFGFIGTQQTMNAMGGKFGEFVYKLIDPLKISMLVFLGGFAFMYFFPLQMFKDFIFYIVNIDLKGFYALLYVVLLFIVSIIMYIVIVRLFFKEKVKDVASFLMKSNKTIGNIYIKVFALK